MRLHYERSPRYRLDRALGKLWARAFILAAPAAPRPVRHAIPPSTRTPTIMLPPGGLPVTPEC